MPSFTLASLPWANGRCGPASLGHMQVPGGKWERSSPVVPAHPHAWDSGQGQRIACFHAKDILEYSHRHECQWRTAPLRDFRIGAVVFRFNIESLTKVKATSVSLLVSIISLNHFRSSSRDVRCGPVWKVYSQRRRLEKQVGQQSLLPGDRKWLVGLEGF